MCVSCGALLPLPADIVGVFSSHDDYKTRGVAANTSALSDRPQLVDKTETGSGI